MEMDLMQRCVVVALRSEQKMTPEQRETLPSRAQIVAVVRNDAMDVLETESRQDSGYFRGHREQDAPSMTSRASCMPR